MKNPEFFPVHLIDFETPKKVRLNGYWIGAMRPKRVIVWVHGLGSSMFSKRDIAALLAKDMTAVLMFNNRGHDKVTRLTVGKRSVKAGSAHEVFTDCLDDINGAIRFAKMSGAREIFLVGHSTGCQKSAYWASKVGRGVKGVVLLAPVSDYAAELMIEGKAKLARTKKVAQEYIRRGKKHELLPEDVWRWPWIADAQRYMSLYTGEGPEEIFTYWDPTSASKILNACKIPVLAVLGERDEYVKENASDVSAWFENNIRTGGVEVIKGAGHSFKGAEKEVAKTIARFITDAVQ